MSRVRILISNDTLQWNVCQFKNIIFNSDDSQPEFHLNTSTRLNAYFRKYKGIVYCDCPQFFTWNLTEKNCRCRARQPNESLQTTGRVMRLTHARERCSTCGNNTDRERLVNFSSWLLKIGSGDIETVPGCTHADFVEIPNSICLNNNSAIIIILYDNLKSQYIYFE